MKDIQRSYMQKRGACFWVAESDGEVVGFVAADPAGEKELELKRLNVMEWERELYTRAERSLFSLSTRSAERTRFYEPISAPQFIPEIGL
ncbi:hypothetical protein NDU88_007133 [Pleurodeles waltl]|uniref:Uncharacterized protein n=1 Tax=Pleurodeles waltl TaxID=8319 RepID=A0AAV7WIB9_PLEWA|nr:hypothetical protein NDU88_007133 [Pleurodeles waltl]